jgi:hypothetical protein
MLKALGSRTVSTPFIYCSRSRPAVPIPSPLLSTGGIFIERSEWKVYRSVVKTNAKAGIQDIDVKL